MKPIAEMTLEELQAESERLNKDRKIYRNRARAETDLLEKCVLSLVAINDRIIELLEARNGENE